MKYWFTLAVCVVASLVVFTVSGVSVAQDEMGGIAGEYAFEGQEGDETYSGTQTVSGIGPVYMLSFEETNDAGETISATAATIAQGNVIALPLPDGENCGAGTLLRQPDGALFSLWLDTSVGPTALGIEYWAPQAETTGFAGSYNVVGTYADGAAYAGTAEVTEGENGVFNILYTFTADAKADSVPFDLPAVGMVEGGVMGYASQNSDTPCGVFVAQFTSEGTYEAVYVDDEGNVGTETGSR